MNGYFFAVSFSCLSLSLLALQYTNDTLGKWLSRLTRNQFLSGAQVQILQVSIFFIFFDSMRFGGWRIKNNNNKIKNEF
jgi:hypothetical protein